MCFWNRRIAAFNKPLLEFVNRRISLQEEIIFLAKRNLLQESPRREHLPREARRQVALSPISLKCFAKHFPTDTFTPRSVAQEKHMSDEWKPFPAKISFGSQLDLYCWMVLRWIFIEALCSRKLQPLNTELSGTQTVEISRI